MAAESCLDNIGYICLSISESYTPYNSIKNVEMLINIFINMFHTSIFISLTSGQVVCGELHGDRVAYNDAHHILADFS